MIVCDVYMYFLLQLLDSILYCIYRILYLIINVFNVCSLYIFFIYFLVNNYVDVYCIYVL